LSVFCQALDSFGSSCSLFLVLERVNSAVRTPEGAKSPRAREQFFGAEPFSFQDARGGWVRHGAKSSDPYTDPLPPEPSFTLFPLLLCTNPALRTVLAGTLQIVSDCGSADIYPAGIAFPERLSFRSYVPPRDPINHDVPKHHRKPRPSTRLFIQPTMALLVPCNSPPLLSPGTFFSLFPEPDHPFRKRILRQGTSPAAPNRSFSVLMMIKDFR